MITQSLETLLNQQMMLEFYASNLYLQMAAYFHKEGFCGFYEYTKFNVMGKMLFANSVMHGLHYTKMVSANQVINTLQSLLTTGVQLVYPSLAVGVSVVSNAAVATYGVYTAIIPAATIASPFRVVGIAFDSFSDTTELYQIELSKISNNAVISVFKLKAEALATSYELNVSSGIISAGEGVQARLAHLNAPVGAKTMVASIEYALIA